MSITIDNLLHLSDLYAGHEGVDDTTLSWRVFGDTKKLRAIRAGRDIQVRRCERAMQWLSDHWPADLEWPVRIFRPPPTTRGVT